MKNKLSEKFLRDNIPKLEKVVEGLKNAPKRVREPHEKNLKEWKERLTQIEANKKKQEAQLSKKQKAGKLPVKQKKKGENKAKKQYYQAVGKVAATVMPAKDGKLTIKIYGSSKIYPLWAADLHSNIYQQLLTKVAGKSQKFLLTVYPEPGEEGCQAFSLIAFEEELTEETKKTNTFVLRGVCGESRDRLIIKRNHKARKKLKKLPEQAIKNATKVKEFLINWKPSILLEERSLYFLDLEAKVNRKGEFQVVKEVKLPLVIDKEPRPFTEGSLAIAQNEGEQK